MRRTFGGITALTALALTGCMPIDAAPPSPASSNPAPELPALPGSDAFGQGLWTPQVQGPNKPLITPNHVIALVGNDIHAWGANGIEAWSRPLPVFDDSTKSAPILRLVSPTAEGVPTTVAVIIHGKTEAEGLSYADYTENFIVFDLETGSTIASSQMLSADAGALFSP